MAGPMQPMDDDHNPVDAKMLVDRKGNAIFDNEGRAYLVPKAFDLQAALDWGRSIRTDPTKYLQLFQAFKPAAGWTCSAAEPERQTEKLERTSAYSRPRPATYTEP